MVKVSLSELVRNGSRVTFEAWKFKNLAQIVKYFRSVQNGKETEVEALGAILDVRTGQPFVFGILSRVGQLPSIGFDTRSSVQHFDEQEVDFSK